eukprot:SAG31_NODE_1550_length_7909_cov_4.107554_5_plen_136_part_00
MGPRMQGVLPTTDLRKCLKADNGVGQPGTDRCDLSSPFKCYFSGPGRPMVIVSAMQYDDVGRHDGMQFAMCYAYMFRRAISAFWLSLSCSVSRSVATTLVLLELLALLALLIASSPLKLPRLSAAAPIVCSSSVS